MNQGRLPLLGQNEEGIHQIMLEYELHSFLLPQAGFPQSSAAGTLKEARQASFGTHFGVSAPPERTSVSVSLVPSVFVILSSTVAGKPRRCRLKLSVVSRGFQSPKSPRNTRH